MLVHLAGLLQMTKVVKVDIAARSNVVHKLALNLERVFHKGPKDDSPMSLRPGRRRVKRLVFRMNNRERERPVDNARKPDVRVMDA